MANDNKDPDDIKKETIAAEARKRIYGPADDKRFQYEEPFYVSIKDNPKTLPDNTSSR